MGKDLLLEIGTEEIPAAFVPKAMTDMEEILRKAFATHRIRHGEMKTLGTPRRLVLGVADVAERQDDQVTEKLGPAKRAAFDAEGKPTNAATGFAKSQGVAVSDLVSVTTDKGEYLCARRRVAGEAVLQLLPEILTRTILSIPFRKSMRWSDIDVRFARPIHWIVALFGDDIVPLTLGVVRSGNRSRGHRFLRPEEFAVSGLSDFVRKAREHFVLADPQERRSVIVRETERIAAAVGGIPFATPELLETVTYLVEYPSVLCGRFDRSFLDLPREVLTTSMISHQKHFPVTDAEGRLLPYFLAVSNTLARDPEVVVRGNERVLRARLSDARFFFEEDRKKTLEQRVADLEKVVFHTLLGTSLDKVRRFRELAGWIAARIRPEIRPVVDRAAWLAKADLDTQMVGEFPELQGIMGREYARISGEDPGVCSAIFEHYLPVVAGGALPGTPEGAIVSIADKTDTIAGFFGVNVIPTGTADPYALRRQALGIIHIVLNGKYDLPLDLLVGESLRILGGRLRRTPEETGKDILEFFRGRFENHILSQGYAYDAVDAVLVTGGWDLVRNFLRIEALSAFKTQADFAPVAVAFKRVGNIIKGFPGGTACPDLFQTPEEKALYERLSETKERVAALEKVDDFTQILVELAGMRPAVDAFFDAVLVMAEDPPVRRNRLSLLWEIARLFRTAADFSRIVTEA